MWNEENNRIEIEKDIYKNSNPFVCLYNNLCVSMKRNREHETVYFCRINFFPFLIDALLYFVISADGTLSWWYWE